MARAAYDPHLRAFVCIEVFEDTKPVLLVSREGGAWCFLCGGMHPQDAAFYRAVGIGHLFDRDPSLLSLLDLNPEWEAERQDRSSPWMRTRINADDG
jgi:hypothetical protein